MKLTNFTVQVIEPENPDNFLTQSVEDLDLTEHTFCKKVYLGVNDSASNWKEVTREEVASIKEMIEKKKTQN